MPDLDQIFIQNTPLIDVRSPVEFEDGHFPTSINLPILENEERRLVGICHREKGAEEAVKLGHTLVSGKIKDSRIERWTSFLIANPNAHLYCYRGGLRSKISTQWIFEAGMQVQRIEGGYKTLRNHLRARLAQLAMEKPFYILGGKTGSGKTAFLKQSMIPFVDLEGLAAHRGSSFGGIGPQPSQATFENALAVSLLKLPENTPILLEDESIMIGSLVIPEVLFSRMKQSPILLLEVPLSERVQHLTQEYVLHRLIENRESKIEVKNFFIHNLKRIQKKLGGLKHSEIETMVHMAFDSSESATLGAHEEWVKQLLLHYYDPLYERALTRSQDRILLRGNRNELASRIALL